MLIKVNTGVRSNDNLAAYSFSLDGFQSKNVLIQGIINLSPEKTDWLSKASQLHTHRADNGIRLARQTALLHPTCVEVGCLTDVMNHL